MKRQRGRKGESQEEKGGREKDEEASDDEEMEQDGAAVVDEREIDEGTSTAHRKVTAG